MDPRPAKATGRPRLPLRDLLFCTIEKFYYQQPLRVAPGLYRRSRAESRIGCIPSQNMPSLILRQPEVGPILHDLIAKSALALASVEDCFAVDSSGFRTTSFGDYCREKYGAPAHNVWIKGHVIVGAKTQIIPKVIVTDGHAADSPQFPGLINGLVAAGFVMKEVYADKGYLSGENFAAVGEAGGTAFIMFKENSRGRGKKRGNRTPFWKDMWHRFQSDPSAYLERYYQREIVEATFAAIKKRLGETIRSRDPVAQFNELLCKVLVHNIQVLIHESFEHGIPLPGITDKPKTVPRPKEAPALDRSPRCDAREPLLPRVVRKWTIDDDLPTAMASPARLPRSNWNSGVGLEKSLGRPCWTSRIAFGGST